jgi:MFS family permease
MFMLLRRRNFGLLWFGGLISLTGDWMLRAALPIHVYRLTGSTLATGLMFMVGLLPALLLSSVAGVFVDRWDRRRTLVIANVLLTVVVLPLALVQSSEWLWIVYMVAFVQSSLVRFVTPAEGALLPTLVEERDLAPANAMTSLTMNLSRLIGPPLGGLVAGLMGLGGVAVIDAATYLGAALLVAGIGQEAVSRPDPARPRNTFAWSSVLQEWLAGLALVRRERSLTIAFMAIAITSVGEGVMSVLFVVFISRVLGGGALEAGWLMAAQAAGGLAGGVLISRWARDIPPLRMLWMGAMGLGAIDLMIFNYPALEPVFLPAVVLMVIVGFPAVCMVTGFLTVLQTGASDAFRGRVYGAYGATSSLMMLVGAGFAAAFGDAIGLVRTLNIQGGGYLLAGTVVLLSLRRAGVAAREREGQWERVAGG